MSLLKKRWYRDGTINVTLKSMQNQAVGFVASYHQKHRAKQLDPEVAGNLKSLITAKLSEEVYGDMLEKYETHKLHIPLCSQG